MQRTRNTLAIVLLVVLIALWLYALDKTSGLWWLIVLFTGPFAAMWLTDQLALRGAYWWHHGSTRAK